jgi:hypothetical protein
VTSLKTVGIVLVLATACSAPRTSSTTSEGASPATPIAIPFTYVGGHSISIPVEVGSRPSRFILDTGIGLNLVSRDLAARVGSRDEGKSYTGKRMSGQAVTVPLVRVPSLAVGPRRREDAVVGVLEMSDFAPDCEGIEGFVGLEFFDSQPFTVDYRAQTIVLETEASLAVRVASGAVVPVHLERDERTVDAFIDLSVPGGGPARVEVDTGSNSLILDARYRSRLGIQDGADGVTTREGKDETGHLFKRTFARIHGSVSLVAAPGIEQRDPEAMFQEIVHDGLVGDAFLRSFVVTFDLPHERMIFAGKSAR